MREVWEDGGALFWKGAEEGWNKERQKGGGGEVSRENMFCFMNNTHARTHTRTRAWPMSGILFL